MSNEKDSTPTDPPERAPLLKNWLDYRRKRFWAIVAVLLYTVTGFFLVPLLVSHFTVKNIKESTGRDATITEVRFNPYVLSLEVNGFEMNDPDGERLLSFDQFFANFQLSSLFRWAWSFREIRLDGAYILYEQFTPEDSRLSRLLADIEQRATEPDEEETATGLPRLLISDLALNEGSLLFRDHAPGETVDIPAGPVTVAIRDLNTLPDRGGSQNVKIGFSNGALLTWQGDLSLQPLASSGTLSLENMDFDAMAPYFKAILPLESVSARLSTRTNYRVGQQGNDPLSLSLTDMELQIDDMALSGLVPSSEFLSLTSLAVSGGELHYPENTLGIEKISLSEPFVDAWLDKDGQPGLLQLVPEDDGTGSPDASGEAWDISIGEFAIVSGRMALSDRGVEPNAAVDLENLQLSLSGINNQDNTSMPLSASADLSGGGAMGFEGTVVALPDVTLAGTATATGIPLTLAQSYVQQQLAVAIEDGELQTSAEVSLDAGGVIKAGGELAVNSLSIRDTLEEKPLLAWEEMKIDRFEIDTGPSTARVSSIRFKQPYGRIEIKEDLSTNVGNLVLDTAPGPEAESGAPEAGWSAVVGGIVVDDGSMDFSDYSLFLPFATKITGLDGTISTIDNQSTEPANIRLEGQVDEFGLSRIDGSINLLDPIANTDITVEFRNLMMSNLSPYSAEFAGREIDEGKLNLDLEYVIKGGELAGQNSVVLSDLVLGDKVDNPDAVSLPLGLAVALLTDSEGVIDIDLPVSGNINDPEFEIGGVIWKAFAGLITKVVAAPFKLLGSLIGIETEDFGQFQFLAGRSDLTPPELEKIGQIQQALEQRPELGLEISGVYNPAIDKPALQFLSLRDTAFARLGRDPTEEGSSSGMLGEEILELLEALFAERFPDTPPDSLKAAHSAPPAGDPEGKPVLDVTAYSGELRDRLIASEPIGMAELEALADQRAQVVADAFLANGVLDPSRVILAKPVEVESEDGEWVTMELGVAAE